MNLPAESTICWLLARYARLREAHGDVIGTPELVEPTPAFFPDAFTPDAAGVARLLRRTMSYAPLAADLPVAVRSAETAKGGCSSGGCGEMGTVTLPNVRAGADGTYEVPIASSDVGEPALLAASLARSVGGLVLLEADEPIEADEFAAASEVAAVVTGLGLLLLNGACVYRKGCGGLLRARRGTHLPLEQLAVGLGVFVRLHDMRPKAVYRQLEVTQREALDAALRWVDSNTDALVTLRDMPALVTDHMALSPIKGFVSRLVERRRARRTQGAPEIGARSPTPRTAEQEARLAEARALVDEALRE